MRTTISLRSFVYTMNQQSAQGLKYNFYFTKRDLMGLNLQGVHIKPGDVDEDDEENEVDYKAAEPPAGSGRKKKVQIKDDDNDDNDDDNNDYNDDYDDGALGLALLLLSDLPSSCSFSSTSSCCS